ncbi:TonB-dependent receptor [Steroidobacter sp. S1-65]|uniref:TonB-dependent receptor n=1 Tax=Steroidobacter gossypii TaxID=2805490 RepID=A0ABS1WY47_9GAMM|nr:TonB-dependent receptor [Steroidobacter gossypii]MBM0105905.1 TonB-dependent receptor [Steroidobacter gossypii]
MRINAHRVLAAATTFALAPTPTFAQDSEATVVVTGERILDTKSEIAGRLALSNRELPAIVDAVTQQDFHVQGVRTTLEAMNAAPGLNSGNLPGSVGAASMRGFHRAINYLYDGVRMANSDVGMRNWDSWTFERVEVIKGPASVTSGEGALAGAINFVPRRPNLDGVHGELFASYGSQETGRLAGDLNLPIGEQVALRGDVWYSRSAGWVNDTDSETIAGTIAVLLQPSEDLSITFSVDRLEDDFDTAYYGTPLVSAAVAHNPSDLVSGSSGLVLDESMRDLNFNVEDGDMGSETTWLRARAEYRLTDKWRIVSDSSYYQADRRWRDADEYTFNAASGLINRGASLITHDHEYWNERVHVAFDGTMFGHRNRFTAGVEVGETDFFTVRRFGSAGAVDPFSPARGRFLPDTPTNFATRQDVTADVKARSFFAEDAYNLTSDWLLVAGVRLDEFELDRRVLDATSGAASAYGQDYDPVTWRVGTVYSVRPETQLFAQFTGAALPVSGLLFLSATNASFKVSTGESYEVGIKTSLDNNRLQLTASIFRITQDDILTRDPTNPALTIQGGRQISEGGEVSLTLMATEEISLELSGTLLNAEFEELIEAGGANRSGNRPQNVPEKLVDIVVSYAPGDLPLTFTGIVRHNGDFFTSNANDVRVDGFTVLDAAISWRAPLGIITLRGRNLTDELYADWSGYASGLVFLGEPRSVEVSLAKSF